MVYCIFYDIHNRSKGNCEKCRGNDSNTLDEITIFVTNLLNNKTIILLNLGEYRLLLATRPMASLAIKVSDNILRDFAG